VVYFGVLVCYLCSMDEILIHFSIVFDIWMTTPTPPWEPMDGSVVTDCTAPGFSACSGTCCTASATRGFPCTVVTPHVSKSHVYETLSVDQIRSIESNSKFSNSGLVWNIRLGCRFFIINLDRVSLHLQNRICSWYHDLQMCKSTKIMEVGK
jgi:hypothetical protein